ncbi:outer surface protein ErpG [Borreliella valaisiana]|uniref:outer surface protein ErpG n=1 Tax=Borreliella valaisiana TaxID=62088 RepID=UPI002ED63386|nr:outer surface protein ErpG [Borreliella valaisiana]
MNKKMIIVCVIFALIISCKNYASGEDLKQNLKEQVKGFLDTKKEELVGGLKKLGAEVYPKVKEELMQAAGQLQGQVDEQLAQGVNEDSELKEKGLEKKDQKLQAQKLKEIENNLKNKEDDRKKELEKAKKKFEEFKRQVESVTENTDKVKNQGKIGQEAFLYAKKLGVNGSYSTNDGTNTDNLAKKIIDDVLKNIEEELKKLDNKKE